MVCHRCSKYKGLVDVATDVTRGQVGVVIYSPVIPTWNGIIAVYQWRKMCQAKPEIQPMTRGLASRGKPRGWSQPPVHPGMHWLYRDDQKTQQNNPGPCLQELDLLFFYQQLPLFNFLFTDFTQHYPSLILFQCRFPHPHCASIPPAWKPPQIWVNQTIPTYT